VHPFEAARRLKKRSEAHDRKSGEANLEAVQKGAYSARTIKIWPTSDERTTAAHLPSAKKGFTTETVANPTLA